MKGQRALLALLFAVQLGVSVVSSFRGKETDLAAYRSAATALVEGRNPYADTARPYLYPPLLAVALTPLRALTDPWLSWLWAIASAAAITASVGLLARDELGVENRWLVPAAILYAPFAATQWNGQVNGFVLLALVAARRWLDDGREVRAGAALGLALALKPIALLVAVWLVCSGRWRAAATAAAVVAFSFLLVVPFLGWSSLLGSAESVVHILSAPWTEPYAANISLNGTLDRLVPAGAGTLRTQLVSALVAGGTLVAALLAGRTAARQKLPFGAAAVDALVAATLLGAGAPWLHHSTLLFPAVTLGSNLVVSIITLLYGVAAAWHRAEELGGGGAAAAAAAAGTCGLAIVWVDSLRRLRSSGAPRVLK
ncbi:MAG: glycosyltransferase family 87 protein [Thermoanaerobaculia bacterium]